MAEFWQYLHFSVQPPKNTAPLPPFPARAGSSHLWTIALATKAVSGHRQKPGLLNRLVFRPNSFMDRYVFPDGELVDIHRTLAVAEQTGFEVRDVEALREHYALTLRHWVQRLEANHERALEEVDEATYRVWRLYMAASSHGFAASHISVYQALLSKNAAGGASGLPWTRQHLYT